MGPPPPVLLPPVTAEYTSTFKQAQALGPDTKSAHTFTRATDGKTRVDSGNISVISDPMSSKTVLLDHLKKTATIQPMPPPPPPPPVPGMPAMPHFSPPPMPGAPKPPDVKVEDLGKSMLQGHEVEGKKFTQPPTPLPPPGLQVPGAPKLPGMQIPGAPKLPAMQIPGAPKLPAVQIPGAPKLPAMQIPGAPKPPAFQPPGAPKPPQMPGMPPPPGAPPPPPMVTEVWKSTKMNVPMLTKMSGGFGELTQVCHKAIPGEPHPSSFQIPPGYKVTGA